MDIVCFSGHSRYGMVSRSLHLAQIQNCLDSVEKDSGLKMSSLNCAPRTCRLTKRTIGISPRVGDGDAEEPAAQYQHGGRVTQVRSHIRNVAGSESEVSQAVFFQKIHN